MSEVGCSRDGLIFPFEYNAYLAIISCSFSVVGAIALIGWYLFSSNKTISKLIVAFIAAADLCTAVGYIVSSIYLLATGVLRTDTLDTKPLSLEDIFQSNRGFKQLGHVQSFFTTTSSNVSFWWTSILAIHLYITLAHSKYLSKKLFIFYAPLAFGVPLLLTVPAAATGWLGYGCFDASSTWAFTGPGQN